jgi:hypothetical protein
MRNQQAAENRSAGQEQVVAGNKWQKQKTA